MALDYLNCLIEFTCVLILFLSFSGLPLKKQSAFVYISLSVSSQAKYTKTRQKVYHF